MFKACWVLRHEVVEDGRCQRGVTEQAMDVCKRALVWNRAGVTFVAVLVLRAHSLTVAYTERRAVRQRGCQI